MAFNSGEWGQLTRMTFWIKQTLSAIVSGSPACFFFRFFILPFLLKNAFLFAVVAGAFLLNELCSSIRFANMV